MSVFAGRIALRMEWVATVGDRMPGTSGAEAIAGMLGSAPRTMRFNPTRRHYPTVAVRMPAAALTTPGRIRRLAPLVDAWWRDEIATLADADLPSATATLRRALARFGETMTAHGIGLFAVVNPMLRAVTTLVERAGVGDVGVLSGTGGAEMAMIEDIWRASRGELTVQQVATTHAFHGPLEGEVSSRVWREDDAPLVAMVEQYRRQDDANSPVSRDREAARRLPLMQREVVAALPRPLRPAAEALLRRAAATIPLRGIGKVSFLQALDVAQASARRIGEHLVAEGRLDDVEDVFLLDVEELTGQLPAELGELVEKRRVRREEYRRPGLPTCWRGVPDAVEMDVPQDRTLAIGESINGIGAGSGVVEGVVRVVHNPDFADVEPGEVLVAPTADPSWASIMFVSAALVVDVGSTISHAAVVARELGLPCVVNTTTGSKLLRDGDVVRVDGTKGTVELLSRPEMTVEA